MRFSFLGLLTVAYLSAAASAQENWPRFRGPMANVCMSCLVIWA